MAAKSKSTRPRRGSSAPPLTQRFHVGQRCAFVFDAASGWAPFDGEECVIIAPKRRMDIWCSDWDGGNPNFQRAQERYYVECTAGELDVREEQLRPLYDGEQLSTWDAFEKATGISAERFELTPRQRACVLIGKAMLTSWRAVHPVPGATHG
jgi:hypothetical protein